MMNNSIPADLPDYFESLSSRPKVACWLAHQIGEENTFTMGQVREALPSVNQIDRRMRELREVGWVILNYRDRSNLRPEEYLLQQVGEKIWLPDYKSERKTGVSATLRRQVMDRDLNRCVVCGIGAGEEYPDPSGRKARLTVGHSRPQAPGRGGSHDATNLRTECALCNEQSKNLTPTPTDVALVEAQIKELPRKDRDELKSWMLANRRSFSRLENSCSNLDCACLAVVDSLKIRSVLIKPMRISSACAQNAPKPNISAKVI
jgi:hypothetical protein